MAADDTPGPKNSPKFRGTGAPATAADLNILSAYAAKLGGRSADTRATRLALTGDDLFDGLEFEESDTGNIFRRIGGAWVQSGNGPQDEQLPLFYGNGFNDYTQLGWSGVRWWMRDRIIYVSGAAQCSLSWSAGTAICKLPPIARPSRQWKGADCWVTTDGNVAAGYSGSAGGAISVFASFPSALVDA